ncbi:hypothetical protein NIES4101_61610 [Calothrix sp. NIES-4101]|nr:hypothetical protein NIES4101_61610 [Calothrix sp. NIES-4101]
MNLFNRITLLKKLAVLAVATGISFLISMPVLAQTNPRPSIFKEFPYNRSSNHRTRQRPKRTLKHRPNARLKKQPTSAQNYRKRVPQESSEAPRSYDFRAPGYKLPAPVPSKRSR